MSAASKLSAATTRNLRQACAKYPHKTPTLSAASLPDKFAIPSVSPDHDLPMGGWSADQIRTAVDESVMLTWTPGKIKNNTPILRKGEGVYLIDDDGNKYLDWTSQAICSNLGYDLPESIATAINSQLRELPFVYGGIGMTEIRARFSKLMTELLPGDLQGMVFPSSGSEANECAIMMARRYTGKHKVINWYRSYHGGTANSLQATGDFRRWYGGDRSPGFVKAFNPYPLFFDLAGNTEQERTQMALNMLEEQILNEGPETIALLQFESIVGAGGVIIPPDGYMQGVRAMCDKYDILLHFDEVMVGFGRTGTMFGFQHFDGVVPDIVTAAKGISGSFQPLSMTACRKHIMEHFEEQSIGWGSTYQAHPVPLACAYENVKYLLNNNIIEHVQKLTPIFEEQMKRCAENHPSIKQYRSIGLFGCFDAQTPSGDNPQLLNEGMHPAFVEYKKSYMANGLIGLLRAPHSHVAPPLVITEEELLDGFDRQDKALDALDEAMGF